MLALLSRLKTILPLLLIVGAGVFVYSQSLRIRVEVSRADAAEARATAAQAAYDSAMLALKELEASSAARAAKTEVVIQEVEKVRVETVEKLVYIDREPVPQTCPEALTWLTEFGDSFEQEISK